MALVLQNEYHTLAILAFSLDLLEFIQSGRSLKTMGKGSEGSLETKAGSQFQWRNLSWQDSTKLFIITSSKTIPGV